MKIIRTTCFVLFLISCISAYAQNTAILTLWPNSILPKNPQTLLTQNVKPKDFNSPFIVEYYPKQSNHIAILVISGGGYKHEVLNKEGTPVSVWLQEHGFTVFELIYRLPQKNNLVESRKFPFADGQRALRLMKSKQKQLNIHKIGVMGFSAGGHLAGMLSTQFEYSFYPKQDAIDELSARPDFAVLLYPVINMQPPLNITQAYKHLLGSSNDPRILQQYSVNEHVMQNTPPIYLVHAQDDPVSPIENSILMRDALNQHHIQNELLIFKNGGHGFGLGKLKTSTSIWPTQFLNWLKQLKFS